MENYEATIREIFDFITQYPSKAELGIIIILRDSGLNEEDQYRLINEVLFTMKFHKECVDYKRINVEQYDASEEVLKYISPY